MHSVVWEAVCNSDTEFANSYRGLKELVADVNSSSTQKAVYIFLRMVDDSEYLFSNNCPNRDVFTILGWWNNSP